MPTARRRKTLMIVREDYYMYSRLCQPQVHVRKGNKNYTNEPNIYWRRTLERKILLAPICKKIGWLPSLPSALSLPVDLMWIVNHHS